MNASPIMNAYPSDGGRSRPRIPTIQTVLAPS
jgi:hypothetical protein